MIMEVSEHSVTHFPPGQGKAFFAAGELVTLKVAGEDTGGAYSLVEEAWPPQAGPPPHIHHTQDETFYVLEGELEFAIDGVSRRAGAGSVVRVPKGVLRAYKNVGSGPAKSVVVFTPGGFEGFFEKVGEPTTESSFPLAGPPDVERLLAAAPSTA
jgi:quercetin dioxygenase-like cupin family protein